MLLTAAPAVRPRRYSVSFTRPGTTRTGSGTRLTARACTAADTGAVLALINADRAPGQPATSAAMLAEARAGRCRTDPAWWAAVAPPRVDVLVDAAGVPRGVVSYTVRPADGVGLVLWLHGREDPEVLDALLGHALDALPAGPVQAFDTATALGLDLEALPVRHRPATHWALLRRGFFGRDLWRYMWGRLPAGHLPPASGVEVRAGDGTHQLRIRSNGRILAGAVVADPVAGIGVLRLISVAPEVRGCGLGRRLLGSSLELLTELGADQVIGYVDDDEPGGDRDRTVANAMYDRLGFTELDRLWSYRLDR